MYTKQPKKLLILNILDVLRRYSNREQQLSQKKILDILQSEYEMNVDRKAVKRNLMNLIDFKKRLEDFGYHLEYAEKVRCNKKGEEEIIYTDWYLERDFTDAELRLLIDSLLFSKHIPYSQCKELIVKIEGLSDGHFKSRMRHVCNLPNDQPRNSDLFYTIEILDEAIEKNRQVVFHYGNYGTDKKLHLRQQNDGSPREYLMNPYQMVATNGKYYLIGNIENHDNITHYRLDRIKDIKPTKDPIKPMRKVRGLEYGLDLPKHMAEHIYMFAGESRRVVMRTAPFMAGELIDWFGNGVTFTNETDDSVVAHVTANLKAMRFWALQYAPYVTILSPQSLADAIKDDLKNALEQYNRI